MIHRSVEARWRDLESSAHLPDVQESIRQEIQNGTIRVRPRPGGGICIVPVGMSESEQPIELETSLAPSLEEASPSISVARRGRLVRR
jgi:hypothetical protein